MTMKFRFLVSKDMLLNSGTEFTFTCKGKPSPHEYLFFSSKQKHKSPPVLKSPLYLPAFTVTESVNNKTQTMGAQMPEIEKQSTQKLIKLTLNILLPLNLLVWL